MKKLAKGEVLRIVRELHTQLDVVYGDRLKGVYLYGSYARGDAREDSDIDVAVVLAGKVNRAEETRATVEVFSEMCLKGHYLIVPFFLSEDEYRERPLAIFRSIAREGVLA